MKASNKKSFGKITGLLSAATCSLLGTTTGHADEWDIDSAVLIYSEKDRVSAVEPVVSMKKDLNETDTLSMKLTLDTLTGSSATGAVPSTQVQTFTRPSGQGEYTAAANELPLDDTFRDTRGQVSMNWDKAIGRNNRRNLGFSFSTEFDFQSISANGSWTHEMNQKNTSITGGLNVELDTIVPIDGTPEPLSSVPYSIGGNSVAGSTIRGSDTEDRQVIDVLIGVTQIIDRSSLFQVNLSHSMADGYLNDPYKMVSIVDTDAANLGEPVSNIYESRPDTRAKTSLYGKYKKSLANDDIVTASLRIMTDDWGVDSQTLDLTYRWQMDSGYYLQPHLRYYTQSAADFYRYFLLDTDTVPEHVSADYRLGEMDATTVGIKFGKTDRYGNDWSFRLEQYVQTGEGNPTEAIGQLRDQDLYPDVEATIVQVNYSFKW